MKAVLLCVGKPDKVMFAPASGEYEKRLTRFCDFTVETLNEGPVPRNEAEIGKTLALEGEKILAKIRPEDHVCALCIEGKQMTSPELASFLGQQRDFGRGRLVFVIGSSHGLCPAVVNRADTKLSMSKMTFPHQLARVMLLEQVYRGFTILSGQTYHK